MQVTKKMEQIIEKTSKENLREVLDCLSSWDDTLTPNCGGCSLSALCSDIRYAAHRNLMKIDLLRASYERRQ